MLAFIKAGKSRAEGEGGSPLAVAHGARAVGYKYLKTKKKSFDLLKNQLVWLLLDNVFEETKTHGLVSLGLAYTNDKIKKAFSLTTKKRSKTVQKEISRYIKKDKVLLEFLMGRRRYACTPWGMPSYSLFGWQKPCYLLQDGYFKTFSELLEKSDWHRYGAESRNPRCADCMVHSGYEASAVDDTFGSVGGFFRTVRAYLK